MLDHAPAQVAHETRRVLELTLALGQDPHLELSAASVPLLVRWETGLGAVANLIRRRALHMVGRLFERVESILLLGALGRHRHKI